MTQDRNAEQEPLKTYAWRNRMSILITTVLGFILLSAGLVKGSDMGLFARQIDAYGLVSQPVLIFLGAWFLVAFECLIGAGLIARYRLRLLLILAFGLFSIFLGATAWAWLAGTAEECGCFGPWMRHSPYEEAVQNLFILLLIGVAFFSSRGSKAGNGRAGAVFVCLAFSTGLLMPLFTGLPLPEGRETAGAITGRASAKDVEVYGIEDFNLSEGTCMVVLMQTDCRHCKESLEQMEILSDAPGLPGLVGLCPDEEEERLRFIDEFMPVFPFGRISEDDFWRLLEDSETPRLLIFQDGKVVHAWNGNIPGIEAVKKAVSSKRDV